MNLGNQTIPIDKLGFLYLEVCDEFFSLLISQFSLKLKSKFWGKTTIIEDLRHTFILYLETANPLNGIPSHGYNFV